MASSAEGDEGTVVALAGVLQSGFQELSLNKLATSLGASEQALRLIISIFLGYPFALFYRHYLFYKESYLIHLYHTFTGLSIAYFNFGNQLYHSLLCIVLQFLILRLMGRTITAVLTTFCFQMAYLLAGYYYTATGNYDIKWTMPHCVLTLKLIGLAVDYFDGGKDQNSLSSEQQKYAIRGVPSLLEVAGFSYFYGAFLVGPQFSMNHYMKLVQGELTDIPGKIPNSTIPALKRLSLGLFYLVGYTLLSPHITEDYLLTEDYDNHPFWFRCMYMLIWGKFVLYKYVTCWLVTEGVCILTGLGFNGFEEKGKAKWDACANMKVWLFETNPRFTGTIASFNINTNAWVARYFFKRLKFLGNKELSQGLSLLFLALWHGLHSGYLVCFQMEFLIVIVERQVGLQGGGEGGYEGQDADELLLPPQAARLIQQSPTLSNLAAITALQPFYYLVQQTIHWLFMGYSMTAFCLFTWDKWLKASEGLLMRLGGTHCNLGQRGMLHACLPQWPLSPQVYKSIYFLGHVFFLSLLFILPYVHKAMVPRKEKLKKME
ncbi:lysophospholipid acyltransferase 5 isoform X1 [Theropithecus gelada]|uniref:lysophospholipid acyltransferase 5 isoform X1 n=2 Tax=Theropithecus gelada TaxID=9565 RepID=UPI000DC1B6EA|nr:lysophospholipid acyltransferase 5 isoform X1 [Theropithecus gelada]